MSNYYIVFDGRASVDEDEAQILETLGQLSRKEAVKQFKTEWEGWSSCLFEYDIEGPEITNGRLISMQG